MAFTVSSQTVHPKHSVRLSWNVVNASNCTITPGVGAVPQSGAHYVRPSVNTTYTLTAQNGSKVITAKVIVTIKIREPTKKLAKGLVIGSGRPLVMQSDPIMISKMKKQAGFFQNNYKKYGWPGNWSDDSPTEPPSSIKNSIGMRFTRIRDGHFFMGSCTKNQTVEIKNSYPNICGQLPLNIGCPFSARIDGSAWNNEAPQHRVTIRKSFYLCDHEVTLGQFKKFITDAKRDDLMTDDFLTYNSHGDNAAVCFVSWNDAQDFIHWLNQKESGRHYRLPTEAEWEYACRAATKKRYSFSSMDRLDGYAWYSNNAYYAGQRYAHDVMKKNANRWRLYDMYGNVWEWCQDRYDADYYSRSPVNDPKGPSSGNGRVRRGGSWYSREDRCRSASRDYDLAGVRHSTYGFRLALDQKQTKNGSIREKKSAN